MDLVQGKRAHKPTDSKWDLVDPTGPVLEVIDVRAKTTVEGRFILTMGWVQCDLLSFKILNKGVRYKINSINNV